ncbi:MAG: threonine--tRNA ligase [bacterium]
MIVKENNNMENEDIKLETLRHSCSHIMAAAVCELYPDTKLAIGPDIENGFYYDFDIPQKISVEDLPKIEAKMQEIINKNETFERMEYKRQDALNYFKNRNEIYKIELLNEIPDEKVSLYNTGSFIDLCRGPHISSTKRIKHFKLLSVAGAYWRGDESNAQLQRIYGTAFFSKDELKDYLLKIEEAKKRDHRKLGKELDLFSIQEEAGAGLIFWHPKGALMRHIIETYWKEEHLKSGYELVFIPHISKIDLWKRSGHLEFYKEYMYSPMKIDTQDYILKPMNCTGHNLIYKSRLHSYRNLPVRFAELGTVYRYERSGVLHGLMRVRGFTQDDAHIFCRPDQLEGEIVNVIKFTVKLLKRFGFNDYKIMVSTRPEKFVGSLDLWEKAESALKRALESLNFEYSIDSGEGVFYGPKIDIKIKDCLGRPWQCSTIQVDFNNPQRFNMTYRDTDGKEKTVIMIHRALMGSLERFFGILIENYAGHFPLWLAPVQVICLSITDRQNEYSADFMEKLKVEGIRAEIDTSSEKISAKIRSAITQKIPYIAIAGQREAEAGTISIRKSQGGELGNFNLKDFLDLIKKELI